MNTKVKLTELRYYPWVVIFFCALFLFFKYILQVSPSVMASELMQHFHIDGAGLGNLAAMYFYAYLVTQLFVGPLLDKYSPRLLMAGAILLCSVGAFGFAGSHWFLTASISRALIGAGAAFATVGYMKMAAVWFRPRQFAFVGGLLATASMLGSMAGQTPMAFLVDHSGWRASLFDAGLIGLVLAVLFFLFVRGKSSTTHPGMLENHTPETFSWRGFLQVLKQKHNWLLMFYSGLAFSPVAVFGGLWGNPFLEVAYHYNKPEAATLTSMMFFGLAVGGPLFGLISDKLGKRFGVMLFGVILSFVALTPVLYVPGLHAWVIGVGLFVFGLGTGAFMLGFALGKELNAFALAASVIGVINTGDAIFGAFSEPLVGKLLDMFWHGKMAHGARVFSVYDFHVALLLLPLYLLLALVCLFGLKKYC